MSIQRFLTAALFLAACFPIGGCTLLPSSGPLSADVRGTHETTEDKLDYVLVPVTPNVIGVLDRGGGLSLAGAFTDHRPTRDIRLGIGDVVAVTIFEAAAGGLFIPQDAGTRPGNFVQLPPQSIDNKGNIAIPYAGLVPAQNRTLPDVQSDIEQRLRNRAIEPQVVLAVQEQRSAQVSVLGEVNAPLRFSANPAGERVLDSIARAGGPKGQGYETLVTLQRGKRQATVKFNTLVSKPENNVFVQPGDTVYVYREQRTFVAFGASGQSGRFNFDAENITLSDAIGRSGGLLDERADPASVFLYRMEDRRTLERMGVDVSRWSTKQVPAIYSVNLRDPTGFFISSRVSMRDKDVLFVANAPAVDIVKFLQLIRIGVAAVREGDASRTIGE